MKKLRNDFSGMVDLGIVLAIGIAFVGMVVGTYIFFKVKDSLFTSSTSPVVGHMSQIYNKTYKLSQNLSTNFDSTISLIMVAITIVILSLAIASLIYLRGRQS